MNTNLLKNSARAQAFYHEGAFVQTSADSFNLFVGPFTVHSSMELAQAFLGSENAPILYQSNFWSFLERNTAKNEYFTSEEIFVCTRQELNDFFLEVSQNCAKKESTDNSIDKIDWNAADQSDFKQQYDWVQNQILHQKLSKGLPISLVQGKGAIRSRLPEILGRMSHHPSKNFIYGFWNKNSGMVGSTPEILSSWSKADSELKTMALAGTWRKIFSDSAPDFLDQKINDEHQFVVQDIENQLESYQLLHKSKTEVLELPYLFHLKTQFSYSCHSVENFIKAIHLLHPTAALGLFPRQEKSYQIFSQMNIQATRQQFGAPFGFLSQTEALIVVAIRNILWTEKKIRLFAGCGVTSESVFVDEWQEILAKQESVKKMLGVES